MNTDVNNPTYWALRCCATAILIFATGLVGADTFDQATLDDATDAAMDALTPILAADQTADVSVSVMTALRKNNEPAAKIALEKLLAWQQPSGGWGYGPGHLTTKQQPTFADLGNTQLAITAARRARAAGIPVADKVFESAAAFALTCQNPDGGFGATPTLAADAAPEATRFHATSHGSATLAGLSILITDQSIRADTHSLNATLEGIAWLTTHYVADDEEDWRWGVDDQEIVIYAWRLADFTELSHFRQLDGHSVRDDIIELLFDEINTANTWGLGDSESRETLLAIDAMKIIARPILVNRLDTATGDMGDDLTRWIDARNAASASNSTWQRISWTSRFGTLSEAPLWLVVANDTLNMSDETATVIRQFVLDGGTFVIQLTQSDDARVEELAKFFETTLDVDAWKADDLHRFAGVTDAATKISRMDLAGAMGVGDGIRLAVAILPAGIYKDLNATPQDSGATGLMDNLIALAAGDSPQGYAPYDPPARLPATSPSKGLAVARVAHDGNWNCCPMIFERLSDVLATAVSIGVKEQNAVDLDRPVGSQVRLLWLTGTEFEPLSRAQRENLAAFINAGGTLFVDSATGDATFTADVRKQLNDLFEGVSLESLDDDHPLMTGQFGQEIGNDLSKLSYNANVTNPPRGADLDGLTVDGRLAVILSPYGVTAAAEGSPRWGDKSLTTDDARRLAGNVLLYVLNQPTE